MPERREFIARVPERGSSIDVFTTPERVALGSQRRQELVAQWQQHLSQLPRNSEGEKHQVSEVAKSLSGFLDRSEYRINFEHEWDRDKDAVLRNSITQMRKIAKKGGVSLPPKLQNRVNLLGRQTFLNILLQYPDMNYVEDMLVGGYVREGVALPDTALVFLNITYMRDITGTHRKQLEDLTRQNAVRYLWETVSWRENWVDEETGECRLKRDGLVEQDVEPDPILIAGLQDLNQQLVLFLTRETLRRAGQEKYKIYPYDTPTVDNLVEKVGEKPFIKAYLTPEGLDQLQNALSEEFEDPNAFWNIAHDLGKPLTEENSTL